MNIINSPRTNLTVRNYIVTVATCIFIWSLCISCIKVDDRLFIDYQVLKGLTAPLRDVVNYEAQINNASDIYQKLTWVQEQINSSLRELHDMVSKIKFDIQLYNHMFLYSSKIAASYHVRIYPSKHSIITNQSWVQVITQLTWYVCMLLHTVAN